MPDPIALLEQDHRAVQQLFERFDKTGGADLARRICQELRLHAALEEDLVYPLLEQRVDDELARQAKRDHRSAKDLITRIERLRIADGGLRDLMADLKDVVFEHVAEEEGTVLPKLQANLLGSELTALGDEIARRREGSLSEIEAAVRKLKNGVNRLSRLQRRAITEDLETMTKAELQAYADEAEIADVDQNRQTKDEMIGAIRAELGA